jgi:hypothetical protein
VNTRSTALTVNLRFTALRVNTRFTALKVNTRFTALNSNQRSRRRPGPSIVSLNTNIPPWYVAMELLWGKATKLSLSAMLFRAPASAPELDGRVRAGANLSKRELRPAGSIRLSARHEARCWSSSPLS